MGVVKKIKRGLNFLQNGYSSGLLGYPRVEYSHIVENDSYDMFPHSSLIPLNSYMSPLTEEEHSIVLNKDNILLFLSSAGAITPSLCQDVMEYLDFYLDADLKFKDEALKEEGEKVLSILENFMSSEKLTDKIILNSERDFAQKSRDSWKDSVLLKMENVYFLSNSKKRSSSMGYVVSFFNKKKGIKKVNNTQRLREQLELIENKQEASSKLEILNEDRSNKRKF